jgi:hypothetical protein
MYEMMAGNEKNPMRRSFLSEIHATDSTLKG